MNERRNYYNVIKSIPVLLLLLLSLSGCGNQNNNSSTANSNKETDVPEIYTEFKESYDGEIKRLDGFEGKTYYSYGLWERTQSTCMILLFIWKIICCTLFFLSRIIWENSLILL